MPGLYFNGNALKQSQLLLRHADFEGRPDARRAQTSPPRCVWIVLVGICKRRQHYSFNV